MGNHYLHFGTNMADPKHIYSRFTRSPKHPFSVVVKRNKARIILYVTYGGGRKKGGGSWSEDIKRVHPRTYNMIESYFGPNVVEQLKKIAATKIETDKRIEEHKARSMGRR